MSKESEEVIRNPEDWEFSLNDCEIVAPINPRTGQSYRFGAANGEFGLEGAPGHESDGARASRRVSVRHVPTGITVVKDDFLPYRNKELALAELKRLVHEWIEKRVQT